MTSVRGTRLLGSGLVLVLAVFGVLMTARPLPAEVGQPVAWGLQVVTAAAAVVAMLRAARRAEGDLRRARRLVAAALVAGAAAGVVATVQQLVTGRSPDVPSFEDVVHLAWLPLVTVALLSYPVVDTRPGSRARSLCEGMVAASALWFATHMLLLEPAAVGAGASLPGRLTLLAYPVGDVFVLGMLASLLRRVQAPARRELSLTGGGLAVYVVSDLAYSVLEAQGRYRADSWVSVVAEVGLVLILLGALGAAGEGPESRTWRRVVDVLPRLPVALVVVLSTVTIVRGDGLSAGQFVAGSALVVSLLLRHVVTGRDRDALTDRLQAREELWRALVTGSSDLVTLHAGDGTVSYASPSLGRTLGIDTDTVLGRSIRAWVHPDDREGLDEAWREALAVPGGTAERVCRLQAGDGEWRWMQTQVLNRLDHPGVRGVVVTSRDVHERHLLEQQLGHAAYHDALTGLGNLARARQLLEACYASVPPRPATVVLVDLDGFKAVNDTFGHARGDLLLEAVAERLRGCVRGTDEVARIGGDEFVLVLDGDEDRAAARVLAAVQQPVVVGGTSLQVAASVGIATTADAASPDELLRNADLAMYASKEAGRNRATAYEPRMHEAATSRMTISRGLRRALDEGGLALHYQPIVSLPHGTLVAAEALLRWHDPEHGDVSPEVFIEVAEQSGLIAEVDVWVLDRACRDVAAWRADGLAPPRVSINISRRQMTAELPDLVAAALARHGLAGEDLCLEVTESAVVPDAEVAAQVLTRVRELGVEVALDDFGTGQSSLSQLARLPVDSVKIDRSFTTSSVGDRGARRLLTSIVRVCQALSLPVVAEGIEQGEVADLLARVGCDRGQGWHFGRPEPEERFRSRLVVGPVPGPRQASDGVAAR